MATPSNPTNALPRPTFPTHQSSMNSSQTPSTFQSYSSSISSLTAPSPASSAPLPSPSISRNTQSFFSPADLQQHQSQQQHAQQQQHQQSSQSSLGFGYTPNRQGAGATAAETANYLSQAALLAEAAKRAQMAVVMRDLDGMEL
ncbi:hypothetical protein DM02DRAFT_610874 [Periconia macrospinosa]|uniref:Uncharacterized protein n=1 Tax=Periconia macrospinosa TaxID=97972 RepID=A0A2V1E7S6_9PLEO|nr:hypothetical protein DM02DRAFT_610874 [Periconia macrospinosa]